MFRIPADPWSGVIVSYSHSYFYILCMELDSKYKLWSRSIYQHFAVKASPQAESIVLGTSNRVIVVEIGNGPQYVQSIYSN